MAEENRPLKYIKYAIGEIVLVVIGILIALQVNNWNENRIEQKRIKKYAKSLIQDLEKDMDMLNVSLFQAREKLLAIDSLRVYMSITEPKDLSNTMLYVVVHDIMYRPYFWNRSTLEELKGSGGLRLIQNDSIAKKLVAYEAFSKHLDEDFSYDKVNVEKADAGMLDVLNLNASNLKKLKEWEINNFNQMFKQKIQTSEFKEAVLHDEPLISYDPVKLHRLLNTCILIQDNYQVRVFKEMPQILNDAQELIELLKSEYNL